MTANSLRYVSSDLYNIIIVRTLNIRACMCVSLLLYVLFLNRSIFEWKYGYNPIPSIHVNCHYYYYYINKNILTIRTIVYRVSRTTAYVCMYVHIFEYIIYNIHLHSLIALWLWSRIFRTWLSVRIATRYTILY